MLKGLVLAFGGFVLFLAFHVLLFRLRVPERRFRTMAHITFALGVVLIVLHRITPSDLGFLPPVYTTAGWAVDLLNGLVVYIFLFFCYCHFYFLVDRGFSGRIMIEIDNAYGRRLRAQDISICYPPEMALRRRLDEMLETNRIVEADGRYRNTTKGQRTAAVMGFVKRFLQLGEGG